MKLQHMSFFTPIATLAAILVAGSLAHAQVVIVSDNFDSYTTGTLANSAPFPTAIPGYGASWQTYISGVNSIEDATSYGRSGNVLSLAETPAGSSPAVRLDMTTSYSGTDTWTASVDFRLTANANTFGYGLMQIFDGGDRLGALGVFESGGLNFAFFGYSDGSAGGTTTFTNITSSLALNTWYTAKLVGNNVTQQISAEIVGVVTTSLPSYYNSNVTKLNRIWLGDTGGGDAPTIAKMDNFALSAVPEPSVALLLVFGGAFALYRRFPRASRQA